MDQFDRRSWGRWVLVTVILLSVVLAAGGPSVSARPPPHAVCGVCSDALVDAAEANGLDLAIAASSLTVRIDDAGTGHWTARVELTGADVDQVRANPSLADRLVDRVYDGRYIAVQNPQSLTTSMDRRTLIVTYEVPGMAHQSTGGVTVVDFFYWQGGEARWFDLAADSMTIRGPPGTVVSHAPAAATADDHAVTWAGGDQQHDRLGARTHVGFAPDGGVISRTATAFGLGADVAQLKAQDLPAAGAPVVIFVTVIALLGRYGHRVASLPRSHLGGIVGGSLAVVALVAATVETLVDPGGPLTAQLGDFLFYLVYALVVTGAGVAILLGGPLVAGQILVARRFLERRTTTSTLAVSDPVPALLLWGPAALLVAQWLLVPVVMAGAAGYDTAYGLVSLVLPTVYFVPLAMTHRRASSVRLAFTSGIVLAPLPVVFAFAPLTGMAPFGSSLALAYGPWALAVGAIGTLAYSSGYRLSPKGTGAGTPPTSDPVGND